jgi:hypothetical protein
MKSSHSKFGSLNYLDLPDKPRVRLILKSMRTGLSHVTDLSTIAVRSDLLRTTALHRVEISKAIKMELGQPADESRVLIIYTGRLIYMR